MGDVVKFPLGKVSGAELIRRVDAGIRRESSSTEDCIFNYIDKHREALLANNHSDAELFKRCLIVGGASTRKGTIALAKYLSEQIEDHSRTGGGIGLMELIDDKRWIEVFLDTLAKQMRRMGSEFPETSKKKKR